MRVLDVSCGQAGEQLLLALARAGDRRAMDQMYIRYFAPLAKFHHNMTMRADLVEGLINDTMLEVWKANESIGTNIPVSFAIMRSAYSRVQKQLRDAKHIEPSSQRAVRDGEPSRLPHAEKIPSDLHFFLSKLPFEQRAVVHLAYASGFSRGEIADIMEIAEDRVDELLLGVRTCAKLHLHKS
jgi:RNA polymerase sigma factor (sigma-70 family)